MPGAALEDMLVDTENQTTGTPDSAAPAATAASAAPPAATNAASPAANKPAAQRSAKQRGKAAAKPKNGATASDDAADEEKVEANPKAVEVWPLRSYQDAGEIKRRGGESYTVPKRHADALIARGLASAEKPKNAK